MSYYFSKTISGTDYYGAIERVTEGLKMVGFGVITTIDIKDTFKQKIGVEFKRYTILGACNPHFAHKALQVDDKIGLFLPCNITVAEQEDGTIEVAAVDPVASMAAVNSKILDELAEEVRGKLVVFIEQL